LTNNISAYLLTEGKADKIVLQKTRTSRKGYKGDKGKTVYADAGIWRQGEEIHIAIPKEPDFHTTVNKKSNSIRCHKNLYNKLQRLLQREGCW
jgi:hypothetical protein